jgi:carbamoyl-phosphate synthase large subunit
MPSSSGVDHRDGHAMSPAAGDRPNVLITSASRKVLLVRAFRDALARWDSGQVFAADISPLSAALHDADGARIIPRSDSDSFIDVLLRVCEQDRIGLLVPTRDEELPVLASARERFLEAGTLVLVSAPECVDICLDKVRFLTAVHDAGLDAPLVYAGPDATRFPAFVKPRRGRGGHGATKVSSPAELAAVLAALGDDALIQEFVSAPEFTIDVFLDLDGTPISCVPRERIAVLAGESIVSRTVRDPDLTEATLRLCQAIGLVGHITVQAFRTPDRVEFIEINPRYGGASNLGFEAGARTPDYALSLAHGVRPEPRLDAYEVGLTMLRYTTDLFVRDEDLAIPEPRA